MKLVLANLGRRTFEDSAATPPLGIMSIASYLRSRMTVDIRLVNQRLDNLSDDLLARELVTGAPDIVGLGGGTNHARSMREIAGLVRTSLPGALIVIGGPHISAVGAPEALEGIPADIAVAGEGEVAMELILREHLAGGDFGQIPGIARRAGDGRIIVNEGELPRVDDLDSIPFLAYDLIDLRKCWHFEAMGTTRPIPYASLSTSRGCPWKCNWCHNIHGKQFRAQSPERVVDEIESLVERYGIRQVEFMDDIFNLDTKRALAFCQLLRDRKLGVKFGFPNGVRTDILTEEIIDALVSAGMNFCSFALESGSPRIQKLCGKRLNVPRFLTAVDLATKRGVFSRGFVILGHPTETREEMEETVRTACESSLHTCYFFTLTPFPGTEVYRIALEKFPEKVSSVVFDGANYHTIRANLSEVPDEALRSVVKNAYRRFYSRPGRVLRVIRDIPTRRYLPWAAYTISRRLVSGFFRD